MTIPPPIILLVDNDPDALEILSRFLEIIIEHAEIVTVDSATAALAVTARREVTLLITDYRMPEMNGVQLATIIKAASPSTHVAIVSGEDPDDMGRRVRDVAEYVLPKPFMLTDLRQMIEQSIPSSGALT